MAIGDVLLASQAVRRKDKKYEMGYVCAAVIKRPHFRHCQAITVLVTVGPVRISVAWGQGAYWRGFL
jgi:hypothetical protein